MREKRPIVFIAFVAGILFLACNMFVQSRLDDSIRENRLIDEQFIEGAPPMVAFTTVGRGGLQGQCGKQAAGKGYDCKRFHIRGVYVVGNTECI